MDYLVCVKYKYNIKLWLKFTTDNIYKIEQILLLDYSYNIIGTF